MAYGQVSDTFWHDPTIRAMSEDARWFMMYLLTSPHRNRLGCFVLDPFYAAADIQWDVPRAKSALQELDKRGRIGWDEEHRVVMIRHFLRHNTLHNQNVVKGALNDLSSVPDTRLLEDLRTVVEEVKATDKRAHYGPLVAELSTRCGKLARHPKHVEPQEKNNGSGNGSSIPGLGTGSSQTTSPIPNHIQTKPDAINDAAPDDGTVGGEEWDLMPGEDRLRQWLGSHAHVVDDMPYLAAKGIGGCYCPGGTYYHVWGDTPNEKRPEMLADACLRWISEGHTEFRAQFFRSFVERSISGPRKPPPTSEAAGWDSRKEQSHYADHRQGSRTSDGPSRPLIDLCDSCSGPLIRGRCPKCIAEATTDSEDNAA